MGRLKDWLKNDFRTDITDKEVLRKLKLLWTAGFSLCIVALVFFVFAFYHGRNFKEMLGMGNSTDAEFEEWQKIHRNETWIFTEAQKGEAHLANTYSFLCMFSMIGASFIILLRVGIMLSSRVT